MEKDFILTVIQDISWRVPPRLEIICYCIALDKWVKRHSLRQAIPSLHKDSFEIEDGFRWRISKNKLLNFDNSSEKCKKASKEKQ